MLSLARRVAVAPLMPAPSEIVPPEESKKPEGEAEKISPVTVTTQDSGFHRSEQLLTLKTIERIKQEYPIVEDKELVEDDVKVEKGRQTDIDEGKWWMQRVDDGYEYDIYKE